MSIFASVLFVLAAVGVRVALEQSSFMPKHAKSLSPLPLGL
jgi:hypothetical protein